MHLVSFRQPLLGVPLVGLSPFIHSSLQLIVSSPDCYFDGFRLQLYRALFAKARLFTRIDMNIQSASTTRHSSENPLLISNPALLEGRRSFIGMSSGAKGVPIDIVALLLASRPAKETTVLCTDVFQSMNGIQANEVRNNTAEFEATVLAIARAFQMNVTIIKTSEIYASDRYQESLRRFDDGLTGQGLREMCLELVPERHRGNPKALLYPLHQLAMCDFVRAELGLEVKIGPRSEVPYDSVLAKYGARLSFAYVTDALPLETKGEPRPVVHYVAGHRENGTRLMCHVSREEALRRIALSSESTLKYLLKMSQVAGRCLWRCRITAGKRARTLLRTVATDRAGALRHECFGPPARYAAG